MQANHLQVDLSLLITDSSYREICTMKRIGTLLLALFVLGCGLNKVLGLEAPGGSPVLMTRVLITKEGGGYKIQYSLQDDDLDDTSASGLLGISFVDYGDSSIVYYATMKTVKKSNFKQYKTLFGGKVWAHVIIIRQSDVQEYGSDTFAVMKLRFVSGSTLLEDEDTFFL
jgi:hypothetical protein